jgi:hypothetical protein
METGAPPQDAAKPDGDHRTPFQQRFRMSDPFPAWQATRNAFEAVHQIGDGRLGRVRHQQVNMVVLTVYRCRHA